MMRAMSVLARLAFFIAVAFVAVPVVAQAPDSTKSFDDARQQITDIRKQLGAADLDDAHLAGFRDAATAIATQADAVVADRTPKLAALDARLSELGPPPAKGVGEAADITAQRNDLQKQRAALDAEIKRAKLLSVDSQQLVGELAEARRAGFQARLSERTASPLTSTFWSDIGDSLAQDRARLRGLRDGVAAALRDGVSPPNLPFALAGLAIGLFLIVFGRLWAERALMRLTADRVPQGRLRRSALAFAVVVVATVFAGGGAQAIVIGFDWHGAFSDAEKTLAQSLVRIVLFSGFVAGLGRALLSSARPSWRLPPISDEVAHRLRPLPFLLGCVVAISLLQRQVNTLIGASLAATKTGSLVVALLYSVVIGWGLWCISRTAVPVEEDVETQRRPSWIGFFIAAAWLGVIVALVAALTGYVALAQQVAKQMVGLGILAGTFYLLVHLIEDLFATLLSSRASWVQRVFGIEPRLLDQFAVLCSGLFRVSAVLLALTAAFAPLGSGPGELLGRLAQAGGRLKIGQIEITSAAVITAIIVFLLGVAAVRALQRWLLARYLPTTRLDPGMRSSVTTLLGYVGGVVVFAFALSALGFSLERITWVASALSVGIGFGLQAVVQNFVSGLILLIERPVKVGDWVVLGDTEGDIRRINVRATEIQLGDRSTVIVPNSELITKSVRNVTLAGAEGRVRLRLPLPLGSDAERVRRVIAAALGRHAAVLPTPAPSVLLDGIEGGSLVFIAVAYVGNPRQSGSVRSDLLFDILARLREEGVALSSPQDVRLHASAPARGGEQDPTCPPVADRASPSARND